MTEPPVHLLMGTRAWQIAQEGAMRLAESDLKYEDDEIDRLHGLKAEGRSVPADRVSLMVK